MCVRHLIALAFLLTTIAAMAAEPPAPDVHMGVLADHAAVKSGESFLVGVLLKLPEGWHVYWKNPGDAGLATKVAWHVPDGFSVSDLMWPVPKRFVQPGDIEGFGYEGQVMLIARVTPPAGFQGTAKIEADVRWLVCKDICAPGRAHGTVDVLVAQSSSTANDETFAQWVKRIPVDAGNGSVSATVHRDGLRFDIELAGLPADGQTNAFAAPPEGVTVRSLKANAKSVTIEFARLPGATPGGQAELIISKQDKAIRILLPLL